MRLDRAEALEGRQFVEEGARARARHEAPVRRRHDRGQQRAGHAGLAFAGLEVVDQPEDRVEPRARHQRRAVAGQHHAQAARADRGRIGQRLEQDRHEVDALAVDDDAQARLEPVVAGIEQLQLRRLELGADEGGEAIVGLDVEREGLGALDEAAHPFLDRESLQRMRPLPARGLADARIAGRLLELGAEALARQELRHAALVLGLAQHHVDGIAVALAQRLAAVARRHALGVVAERELGEDAVAQAVGLVVVGLAAEHQLGARGGDAPGLDAQRARRGQARADPALGQRGARLGVVLGMQRRQLAQGRQLRRQFAGFGAPDLGAVGIDVPAPGVAADHALAARQARGEALGAVFVELPLEGQLARRARPQHRAGRGAEMRAAGRDHRLEQRLVAVGQHEPGVVVAVLALGRVDRQQQGAVGGRQAPDLLQCLVAVEPHRPRRAGMAALEQAAARRLHQHVAVLDLDEVQDRLLVGRLQRSRVGPSRCSASHCFHGLGACGSAWRGAMPALRSPAARPSRHCAARPARPGPAPRRACSRRRSGTSTGRRPPARARACSGARRFRRAPACCRARAPRRAGRRAAAIRRGRRGSSAGPCRNWGRGCAAAGSGLVDSGWTRMGGGHAHGTAHASAWRARWEPPSGPGGAFVGAHLVRDRGITGRGMAVVPRSRTRCAPTKAPLIPARARRSAVRRRLRRCAAGGAAFGPWPARESLRPARPRP